MAKAAKKAAPKAKASAKVSKAVKKPVVKTAAKKTSAIKAKPAGSKRLLSDAKIGKLQKMYKSNKFSAQQLCDEFCISMATLFNYLKVSV